MDHVHYPLPYINNLLVCDNELIYFIKLNLSLGYHQLCIYIENYYNSGFISPDGLYDSQVILFRYPNTPAAFMYTFLPNPSLDYRFVVMYLNNILAYSCISGNQVHNIKAIL
jgi:hypothetical protein